MQFKINEPSPSYREIEVTLPYNEIEQELAEEVKRQVQKLQLPGFRKGKVPMQLIKQRFGDALEYDASEKIANDRFWKISEDENLNPIGTPELTEIKFSPNEELYFKIRYEIVPVPEVKDYTGQTIEIPDLKATEEDIDSEIKFIYKRHSTQEETEVVGEDENYILEAKISPIDDAGEPIEAASTQTAEIDLSDERVFQQIKTNARGKRVGDSFVYTTEENFEADESKSETGKKPELRRFRVLIEGIKKIVPPELNAEFFKQVSGREISDDSSFREYVRDRVQAYYDIRTEEMFTDRLTRMVVENSDFTPAATFVNKFLEGLMKEEENRYKQEKGKKLDKIKLRESLTPIAEFNTKWFFLREAIKRKENLTISEEELLERAKKESETTGITIEKLLNYYKSSDYFYKLSNEKLFEFLKANNTINKVDPKILIERDKNHAG